MDVNDITSQHKESSGPGPKAPPQAKVEPGSEPENSERMRTGAADATRKKGWKNPRIEGSRRLTCKRCGHFLVEVKSKDFEALTVCGRCKTENYFACQELKPGL